MGIIQHAYRYTDISIDKDNGVYLNAWMKTTSWNVLTFPVLTFFVHLLPAV